MGAEFPGTWSTYPWALVPPSLVAPTLTSSVPPSRIGHRGQDPTVRSPRPVPADPWPCACAVAPLTALALGAQAGRKLVRLCDQALSGLSLHLPGVELWLLPPAGGLFIAHFSECKKTISLTTHSINPFVLLI